MKLVTFLRPEGDGRPRPGVRLDDGRLLDLPAASRAFRDLSLLDVIREGKPLLGLARDLALVPGSLDAAAFVREEEARLLAPLPRPVSVRDGYAFRQHVETARRNRGVPMIPEFDLFPVFYFTNHLAVIGPGELRVGRSRLERLDFELECFCVIGKTVTNPTLEE